LWVGECGGQFGFLGGVQFWVAAFVAGVLFVVAVVGWAVVATL